MFSWLHKKRHPLELEAERVANTVQHQLTRLNLAYREKVERGVEVMHKVEFVEPLIATPSEIRLEVDMGRLPRAVTITDLRQASVLETLSVACKFPIRAEHKKGKGGGFWFIAELEERSTIPKMVKFSDMKLPAKAPALIIPIGMGENKKQQWEDLRDLPHLLIAGATKQGKSVMVNDIICWLARRLTPEQLHFYLCDLKGGMELSFYEDLPHTKQLVTKNTDLPLMLFKLQREMERRTALMSGKARDLDDYNKKQLPDKKLPYLVVVIDEIANAMLSKDRHQLPDDGPKGTISALTESLLADLAARARATGIHLVVSTQRPSVDVVTGLIKANFPARIAFGTASEIDSRVIIDDSSAHGLLKGRMKFRRNMDLLEIQAPFLSDDDVISHVKKAIIGERLEAAPTPEELERAMIGKLLSIAETQFNGRFATKKLYPLAGMTQTKVEEIALKLEFDGILKQPMGRMPRTIIVPPEHWKAKYPPILMEQESRNKPQES